jgi:uncharacterized membrane protein
MAHIRVVDRYEVPVERIYELALDWKRYPEWNVTYPEVKEVIGPVDKVGTKVHVTTRFLGRQFDVWGEIVEIEPLRMVKLAGTGPEGSYTTITYRWTPVEGGTECVIEADYQLPAGLFGQIADKLFIEKAVERDIRHSIENFKALLEAKVPVLR